MGRVAPMVHRSASGCPLARDFGPLARTCPFLTQAQFPAILQPLTALGPDAEKEGYEFRQCNEDR